MRELRNSYLSIFGWGVFLASALSLGSCSSDETIDAIQGEAISFGNAFVENSTRATDPSYGAAKALEQFNVWGTVTGNTTGNTVNIFNGATVTKGDAAYGAAWTCDQTQYWIPDATYNFMAIAHGTVTSKDEYNMPLTISYTADGSTDLLLGELSSNGIKTVKTDGSATPTTGVIGNEKVVDFTMSHLLSKVVFTFNNNDKETALKVKDIKLTGTSSSGTYTIATGQWSDTNTGYELGFGNEVTIAKDSNGTSELERLIIPGTYNLGISFKVNDEEGFGDEQVITYPEEGKTFSATFVAGQSYNITANIKSGMKEIIFNVTSAAWGGNVNNDIDIN